MCEADVNKLLHAHYNLMDFSHHCIQHPGNSSFYHQILLAKSQHHLCKFSKVSEQTRTSLNSGDNNQMQ